MSTRRAALDIAVYFAVGYVATAVADRVHRLLWQLEPAEVKAREPGTGPSPARRMARGLEAHEPLRLDGWRISAHALHMGIGAGWAAMYRLLRNRCALRPLPGGLLTGLCIALLVDEGIHPALRLTPPPRAYPPAARARRLLARAAYGASLAFIVEGLRGLLVRPRR